ncbi:MAG: hypothetical protein JWO87_1454 [Phycisphaerales bacterium]|jgi:hypothetical protein|nr:hypothetical protein [Phycisphaerales bacterium]MDB5304221.1 hypothetical protein [Phycisphaerales bacterium]
MMRRFFTLLSAVSLLLCVATGVLWVRSRWASTGVIYFDDRHLERSPLYELYVIRGKVGIVYFTYDGSALTYPPKLYDYPTGRHLQLGPSDNEPDAFFDTAVYYGMTGWHLAGFGGFREDHGWAAFIPCWALMVLSAYPPFVWGRAFRRRVRWKRNQCCPTCGYDLRATHERCPECGTQTELPAMASKGGKCKVRLN